MRALSFLSIVTILAIGTLAFLLPAKAETVNPVLRAPLLNAPGQELSAVVVRYPPGGKSAPHRHAGSVFAYVLSGSIRSRNSATGPTRIFHVGEGFFEPEGSVHLISENASSADPASMLAVFVAPVHASLTKPFHR